MEIMITLAILGILVVSFTSLFANGMIHIFTFGQKSQAIHVAQTKMENTLAGEQTLTEGQTDSTSLTIHFSSGKEITVQGKKVTVDAPYKNGSVSLTSFIPNR